jgi:hypothetical protein
MTLISVMDPGQMNVLANPGSLADTTAHVAIAVDALGASSEGTARPKRYLKERAERTCVAGGAVKSQSRIQHEI